MQERKKTKNTGKAISKKELVEFQEKEKAYLVVGEKLNVQWHALLDNTLTQATAKGEKRLDRNSAEY